MSAAFMYKQKVDISYCGDKTGFPRPGHNYSYSRMDIKEIHRFERTGQEIFGLKSQETTV